jgi:transposase
MDLEFNPKQLWCRQTERRLYELGALVKGQVLIQADRLADVLEQVDELRQEVKAIQERMDRMADYVKKHVKNGGAT